MLTQRLTSCPVDIVVGRIDCLADLAVGHHMSLKNGPPYLLADSLKLVEERAAG